MVFLDVNLGLHLAHEVVKRYFQVVGMQILEVGHRLVLQR